ncbi:uncharacterized protein LOC135212244 [Macrobrachium nipponense]|uniref:uncharacterized protein LOC135212244 n=1 Tax=Macrobrachium nipponense TaxID=159736 RepID=UPI0030C7C571
MPVKGSMILSTALRGLFVPPSTLRASVDRKWLISRETESEHQNSESPKPGLSRAFINKDRQINIPKSRSFGQKTVEPRRARSTHPPTHPPTPPRIPQPPSSSLEEVDPAHKSHPWRSERGALAASTDTHLPTPKKREEEEEEEEENRQKENTKKKREKKQQREAAHDNDKQTVASNSSSSSSSPSCSCSSSSDAEIRIRPMPNLELLVAKRLPQATAFERTILHSKRTGLTPSMRLRDSTLLKRPGFQDAEPPTKVSEGEHKRDLCSSQVHHFPATATGGLDRDAKDQGGGYEGRSETEAAAAAVVVDGNSADGLSG